MEIVIFVGLQASGKSSFYRERFLDTHVRINLDMLKTRRRERILLEACIAAKQPFVVDNTNTTIEQRGTYIAAARAAGFRVVGYYFTASAQECIRRNEGRQGRARVPVKAIGGASRLLQIPIRDEGFDLLFHVHLDPDGAFLVEEQGHAV